MESMTTVVLALGVLAILLAWPISFYLIGSDKFAGPKTGTLDQTAAPEARELATASSN